MTVGIAGRGPATEAVEAVLAEGTAVETIEPEEVDEVDLAVVVGPVGASSFRAANEAALSVGSEWIGVELGGIGGHALGDVEAAVCGFGPETGCFECLDARVASNVDPAGNENESGGGETDPENAGIEHAAESATARLAGTIAGREAFRVLAGAPIGGVIELPYTERELLAVPGCVCASEKRRRNDRTGALDRGYRGRTLDEAITRAERALDRRVGIVREVGEASSFPVPYYLANLSETTPFSDARATPQAAGVAADWDEAFMKAIGEALERYCAGVYRVGDLPENASDEFERAISPAEFVGVNEADADGPIRWVRGEELRSGSSVALPAAFALFPPPENGGRPSITTGLGLGNSGAKALLSGLYEVIERDATMIGWYSTFEPLGLRVESERFEVLRRRARAEGLSVTALLVTQDVDVPVVAVAVHREGEWPRFAVGSDADLDATRASESALSEALQNWTELRDMGTENAEHAGGAVGRYGEFPAAAREFVGVEEAIPAASVGGEGNNTDELDAVLDRLAAAGLDVYGTRLTTRDVAALGFEVVRVLAPAAQPLFTGDAFFGARARTVPESLGFESRLDREPHPYP